MALATAPPFLFLNQRTGEKSKVAGATSRRDIVAIGTGTRWRSLSIMTLPNADGSSFSFLFGLVPGSAASWNRMASAKQIPTTATGSHPPSQGKGGGGVRQRD